MDANAVLFMRVFETGFPQVRMEPDVTPTTVPSDHDWRDGASSLLFAGAGTLFGSSRPAVLSLIAFFIAGMILLLRVDVEAGRRVARAEEDELESRLD